MAEPLRPQLGEHAEALIADALDHREETIINSTIAKLATGLDPQAALNAWYSIAAARQLRATLIRQAKLEKTRTAQNL